MTEYIKGIIAKREKPIYSKDTHEKRDYYMPINHSLYAKIQQHAANMGESATAFINRAIDETMERDNQKGE